MGSRDRDTKSFQDKLKVFFKKGPSAPLSQNELVITPELQKELGCDTPLGRRLRVIREVTEKVLHVRVHEGGVDKIWATTKDLLEDGSAEARHAVLALLRSIAEGQQELLIMRTILFRYLHETPPARLPDDYPLRFKLLYSLTNSGKDIKCLEDQIGSFLLEWFPEIQAGTHMVDFVHLVTNVVKFNAVYLDEEIVHGIVNHACHQCVYSGEAAVVLASLALLEAVVSYSLLPLAALPTFVAALCRTVNVEHYCQPSWKLMRLVLAADLGHAALRRLVHALRAPPADADAGLARGAVFHVNMALWGPNRVPSLHASHLAVLPAFRRALDLRRPVVTYEVVMALQSLVARAPLELHEPAWDALLDIVDAALEQARAGAGYELTATRAHALLSHVEQLQEAGQYLGDGARLLALLDAHAAGRPESSAARVVAERAAALRGADVAGALALVDRYVRRETRLPVRLHALAALLDFIKRNRIGHGSELAERVGGALAAACATAPEAALRAAAARALPQLARLATTDACIDLIDHLERILNRPFEVAESGAGSGEGDGGELRAAAAGLVDLFQYKVLRAPAAHAARVFVVLLDHLDLHYRRPAVFSRYPDIRLQILDMIFGLRANAANCVGFVYDAAGAPVLGAGGGGGGGGGAGRAPLCSALLLAEPPAPRAVRPAPAREPPPGACVMPVGRAARTLVSALTREADWAVLAHVLRALPPLLTARALAPGRRAMDLDLLASTLCSMVADRSMCVPERLAGVRLPVSQFHAAVLPALAALAGHHAYLEPQTQQRVVRCLLKYGMVLRTPQPYIVALTLFTLEARDTMVKLLPEVLLDLSKISDTTAIAGPMLEFLSTLTRLPRAFASFVEDQYMSVFAIVLPYTNHARYNHYVVSLAHHVIAAWFLKCRLSYRRNFVKFIIHGLHNYIIMPFEEQLQVRARPPAPPTLNEDSSNRQRSSSLGSRAVSRPLGARGAGRGESGAVGGAGAGGAPAAFHVELTETCVDLLARYTFTPCSAKPQRSDTAEFLFSGGQSTTWLVGHKLVTVTTSGCLQNSIKQGLCERCATLCRQHAESVASPLPSATPPAPPPAAPAAAPPPAAPPAAAAPPQLHVDAPDAEPAPEIKRYSRVSLQHSRSTDTSCSSLSEADARRDVSRQNSSENKSQDPIIDAINQFSQRFEMLSKEVDCDETGWSRVGALAGGGACPCWCARWAELHVRSPTGDVSWLLRLQNHISSAQLQEWPLQDVLALLSPPPLDIVPTSAAPPAPAAAAPLSAAPAPTPPRDLHKSSSDSVVAGGAGSGAGPPRTGTRPINIPGSPQRQSSSSTTDDDDLLLMVPEGKSRHPVRRSNSSPEMSSWKARALSPPPPPAPQPDAAPPPHVKKPGKKGGVSCEAIPEEMCGTSPQPPAVAPAPVPAASSPHAPLMTYNSDPGTAPPETDNGDASGAADSHLHLQKTSSDSRVASGGGGGGVDELPPLARSKRSNTISVMSPTRRTHDALRGAGPGAGAAGGRGGAGGGLAPSFVFLQLYHNMSTAPCAPHVAGATRGAEHERPLKISGVQHERTIKNLDLVPPVETYKVGVLYVGPGQQDDEVCILRNEHGSVRYCDFLRRLGSLVPLDADEPNLFLNLERGGEDGTYTYVWTDDVMQVQFHVATAMPTLARDPSCNEKRKYIGNDYVSIVYNDSGQDFSIHTIKGQFNSCIVVVEPLAGGTNRVRVCTKDERIRTEFLPHLEPNTVSDTNVALLARQQALHCSLAAMISQSLVVGGEPYASNWLARLRLLKRLRARATADRRAAARPAPYHTAPPPAHPAHHIDDFNDYA